MKGFPYYKILFRHAGVSKAFGLKRSGSPDLTILLGDPREVPEFSAWWAIYIPRDLSGVPHTNWRRNRYPLDKGNLRTFPGIQNLRPI